MAASVGATAFFALATALKHRSAGETPRAHRAGPAQLARFVAATAQHPLWLAGLAADAAGLTLQVTALHLGALAVVQPLMITALLFSLVANHQVAGTRISSREVAGGVVLVAALIAFLFVSGASSPKISGPAAPADKAPAVAIGVASLLIASGCVLAARRLKSGRGPALIGVAVGLAYACTAALIKSCSNIAVGHHLIALATSWQLYVLVVTGIAGLVLSQLAFQAGPLRASLPVIATVDPLVSILLGVLVYDEHLRSGPAAIAGEIACLLVLFTAAIYLGRLESAPTTGGAT